MPTIVSQPATVRGSIFPLQFLGLLGMTCAPGMLADASIRQTLRIPGERLLTSTSVIGLVYVIGWAASMIGFRWLRLTGDGTFARIVFLLQMIGLTLAATQQVIELNPNWGLLHSSVFGICDLAWPLSHLFMLIVGGMVLAKARVHGLARFAPIGCGAALPLSAAIGVVNHTAFIFTFGVVTTVCFALVGLTVYRAGLTREV